MKMDLDTKNLIYFIEESRKRAAQRIIDTPEFADMYQVGKAIDELGRILHLLRSGQMSADEFEKSIPWAPELGISGDI